MTGGIVENYAFISISLSMPFVWCVEVKYEPASYSIGHDENESKNYKFSPNSRINNSFLYSIPKKLSAMEYELYGYVRNCVSLL